MSESAPELMRVPLGQLADVDPEVLPESTSPQLAFKYVDIASVSTGRIALPSETTAFAEAPSRARMKLRSGDVLMSTVRPNLKAFAQCRFDDDNVVASTGFAVIRAKENADSYFLLCSILSSDVSAQIERVAVGSNYPAINVGDVQRLLLPKFSLEEQRGIGAALRSLDNAIEAAEALIEKHQQIKAGLMHDLFTRGVGLDGRLRPVDESVLTPFGRLPMHWRFGSILELTDPGRQPVLTGPFGADLGSGDFLEEGVPVLRIGNVQAGHLAIDDLLFVSHRKAQTLNRYRVKEGDLLFARQGATTGRNALADARVEGNLINYHIIRVALDHDRCAPLFVEAAFASEVVKRQIERDKGRGTREGINTAQITSLAFPIAEVEEQRRIAAILSSQNDRINADRDVLRSLRMKKLGLMQDLLTGKVRVPLSEPEGTI